MTTSAHDSDEQPDFELLVDADLPEEWRLPERSPLDTEKESGGIDLALHYEEWIDNVPGLDRKLRSEHGNLDEGRWFLIQHTETGTRVLLRLQRQVRVYQDRMGEVRIAGVVHLPFFAGDPITSQQLRELPTAKIEAAINKRLFAVTGASRFENGRIISSEAIQYPDGNHEDQEINSYAIPQLNAAVVEAQSAGIDAISGATVTSDGYITSLQSAIDQANL